MKWVDVTGRIYAREEDAARRMRELQQRFPDEKFRPNGHLLVGWCVQQKVKS